MKINIGSGGGGGGYARAKRDLNDGDVIKFTDEGEYTESKIYKDYNGNPKRNFDIGIELPSGTKKKFTLNKTNQTALVKAFGGDSKDWVGKTAKVETALALNGKHMVILTPVT